VVARAAAGPDRGHRVRDRLNNRGVVVGGALPTAEVGFQGMVRQHGRASLLYRPPGYDYTSALKVDDRGQVLGFAGTDDFSRHQPLVWQGHRTVALAPLRGGESAAASAELGRRGTAARRRGRGPAPEGKAGAPRPDVGSTSGRPRLPQPGADLLVDVTGIFELQVVGEPSGSRLHHLLPAG
jgi:hypothetical protein